MSGLEQFEREYVRPLTGPTLIVGSRVFSGKPDRRKLYPDAIGVDRDEGEGVDLSLDMEEPAPAAWRYHFAHVECMSVLEHSMRPWRMAEVIESVLQHGGTLFVSLPWTWRAHNYPADNWRVSPNGLAILFPQIEWVQRAIVTDRKVFTEMPKKHPSRTDENGEKYLLRCETVGFGVRR